MFKSSCFSLVLLTAAFFFTDVSAQGPVASISSAETSKCLAVRASKFADGTAVEMQDCDNSTAQQWGIYSGLTEIIVGDPNLTTKYCVDAKTVDESSRVVIWECNQNPWQQWIFTDDGLLTLANNTNLCLEVPGHNKKNGAQVQTYACNGGLNQIWNLV